MAKEKTIKDILEKNEVKMMTQKEIIDALAEEYELPPNRVRCIFEGLAVLAADQLAQKDVAAFIVPGVGIKLSMRRRAAREARQGRNPITGETMTIPPQPEKDVIKASVQKRLKDRVGI